MTRDANEDRHAQDVSGAHDRFRFKLGAETVALAVAWCVLWMVAAPAIAVAAPVETGWVRLAHLSPDTAEVDVRLTAFDASTEPVILTDVGYGDVSDYQRVPAGFYTVAMVPAGAPADSAPVLSASVEVADGVAYTIAAVGRRDQLTAKVFTDDLTPPPDGQARVRVLQAATSAPVVDVTVVEGPAIAEGAAFGSVTPYVTVPAQTWTVQAGRVGEPAAVTTQVPLAPGSVNTLVVLDDPTSGLTIRALGDSTGTASMPEGGVRTGHGPSGAPGSGSSMSLLASSSAVSAAILLAVALWRRRSLPGGGPSTRRTNR